MNKIIVKPTFFCIVLIMLALLLVSGSSAQLNMKDVLAIWTFDEGTGNKVNDVSGKGVNGNFVDTPKWVSGKFGKALSFDGDNDSVVMNSPVVVDKGIVDITMGCWVNPADSQKNGWPNLLSCHNNGVGGLLRGASMEQSGQEANKIYFIGGIAEANWILMNVTTQLKAGEWQHFVVMRQGTTVRHYLNGQVSAEGVTVATPFEPATDNFQICNWSRGKAEPRNYKAIVDETFVFKRALSQDEITTIMKVGLANILSVDSGDKMTATWGNVKSMY